MDRSLTLGSLFDGSGGFPLAGKLCGITPIWASEIEPFPIMVTTKRLPEMKHLGDVSAINGAEIEPVDIITFGSPCQDMSIAGTNAGKRAGLNGSRSSLFYQAIRIIKEMRKATDEEYPTFIIWENVAGAFSSNKGEDFRTVLGEICKVKDDRVSIPQFGKWRKAGMVSGDGYSAAWRLLDAQYWGVPQRRKRIYLVADFNGGGGAGKILFEPEGVSGYPPQSFCPWKRTACRSSESIGETGNDGTMMFENHSQDSRYTGPLKVAETVAAKYGTGGNNTPLVLDTPKTLKKGSGAAPTFSSSKAYFFTSAEEELANALGATDWKDPPVVYDTDADFEYIVRRLTPTECARLQGFPDWWCEDLTIAEPTEEDMGFWRGVFKAYAEVMRTKPKTDKQIRKWLRDPKTDSAQYKMWGNGVALPCAYYVLSGIKGTT